MQQPEVHKHMIETAVFKWQVLCVALPESDLWKHSLRDRDHLSREIDSCGKRAELFRCG